MIKKYKLNKIKKVIDNNFIYLMTDFYQMQTDFFFKLYSGLKDFEKSFIIIFLFLEDKKNLNENKNDEFGYDSDNKKKSISVIEISKKLFLSKESARRKLLELTKINMIFKKNKKYHINFDDPEINKIYKIQNELSSKFISKFSFFLKKNEFFGKSYTVDEIKNYFNKDEKIHFSLFLKLQLKYYYIYKPTLPSFDIVAIFLLIVLNNTYFIKKNKLKKSEFSFLNTYKNIHLLHENNGLNATTVSDLSGIPRASVLRKIQFLIKEKLVKKNQKNLYYLGNLSQSKWAKKNVTNGVPQVLEAISDYLSSTYGSFK